MFDTTYVQQQNSFTFFLYKICFESEVENLMCSSSLSFFVVACFASSDMQKQLHLFDLHRQSSVQALLKKTKTTEGFY